MSTSSWPVPQRRGPIRSASAPHWAACWARELAPASKSAAAPGRLVHIGVHPCFCGGFADRSDPASVVIRPGYRDGHWTKASWPTNGFRDKVGATHLPLPSLMHAFLDAGLTIERLAEGGEPIPITLAIRARERA